ncbi:hypothetical protein CTheo_763 [Ceratobasidium theobromae]|uniref:Transmembrane protein n=1 Tax=Ceratobasidium theobromae TaxID=1582974 RepID=A0A5N5QVH1_9AGAM|nr:hypothetical protein CTheo_763 [Ceratobasidium theobromae]
MIPPLPAAYTPSLGALQRELQYEELEYAEIVLHYLDGTKYVLFTSDPDQQTFETPGYYHQVLNPEKKNPYKATWTRMRYVVPSGQCVDRMRVRGKKVKFTSIQVLPSDAHSGPGTAETPIYGAHYGGAESIAEYPTGRLGGASYLGDEVYHVPLRRRATFGEVCQLLVLFLVLGVLHYVSMQWATRWQAPLPDRGAP